MKPNGQAQGCILHADSQVRVYGSYSTSRGVRTCPIERLAFNHCSCRFSQRALLGVHSPCSHVCVLQVRLAYAISVCVLFVSIAHRVSFSTQAPVHR